MKILKITLTILTIFLLLCSCADAPTERGSYSVRIMLRGCEGITISGKNIVDTEAGRTVTFNVSVDEGYTYIGNTADADFNPERGTLRLQNVIAPATIDMIVVPDDEVIHFNAEANYASCSVNITSKALARPERLALDVDYPEHFDFLGWSEGGYLDDGGTLISDSPKFSLFVGDSKTVYANFTGITEQEITYHLNGGHVVDSTDEAYSVKSEVKEIYSMRQTLESNGTFVREGYAAVGYSTAPADYADFSSANDIENFANMGGVTEVLGRSADLYVVWAKENPASDFDFEEKDIAYVVDSTMGWGKLNKRTETVRGIEITGYRGCADLAVIPEEINGLPVLSIAKNAFICDLERVVIPRTVKNIASGAFDGCSTLREVVLFDSVVEVYNQSFPKSVQTVVLNAQRLPVYSGQIEGSFCIKYERLRTTEGQKIVVVSGSSSLNGLNSPLLEELTGYSVVNYGTNAANPSLFFLEVIAKYAGEGDIIVHAPEYSASGPMGSNAFHAKVFRGCEQCYDIFRDVDISNYEDFWQSFCEFQVGDSSDNSLTPAVHQSGKPYQQDTELNKYGDRTTARKGVRGNFGGATETFTNNKLNAENLNAVNKLITENGAALVMSFGTFDKSRLTPNSATEKEFDRFTEACRAKLDYPVISNIGTYVMEHKWFFDSEWHPNDEGAKLRTENLAKDIQNYLKEAKK